MSSAIPKTRKAWKLVEYAQEKLDVDKVFKLVDEDIPELNEDEILVKADYLAAEPTMRNSISARKSYQPPLPIDATMWAFGTGSVVASKAAAFPVGTLVGGVVGMTTYATVDISGKKGPIKVFKVPDDFHTTDGKPIDPREMLSAFGPPGTAAYTGLFAPNVGNMQPGDHVLVDGAAGATGLFVIQMAKARGAGRIIGIASSRKKQAVLDAGADAFIAYDDPDFEKNLHEVTEDKINLLFENVGGHIFEAALTTIVQHGRVALCGLVSEYDSAPYGNKAMRTVLMNRLNIKGFIQLDKETECGKQEGIMKLLKEGKIQSTFHEFQPGGIENVVACFVGLFEGKNIGKMTIKI